MRRRSDRERMSEKIIDDPLNQWLEKTEIKKSCG